MQNTLEIFYHKYCHKILLNLLLIELQVQFFFRQIKIIMTYGEINGINALLSMLYKNNNKITENRSSPRGTHMNIIGT